MLYKQTTRTNRNFIPINVPNDCLLLIKKHVLKVLPWLILLLLYSNNLTAQVISGRIADSAGKPLHYVNVTAFQDKNIAGGAVTDSAGQYKIVLKSSGGEGYRLRAALVGYVTSEKEISVPAERPNMTVNLFLKEEINSLKEVIIKEHKKIYDQKVDRFVFNVENSPLLSTGSNAFEALTKTPGIISSAGSLSIVGKGSVTVMINDRLIHLSGTELYSYLNSIPSDNISSIEVITAPGAKYDANGDGGIINIVTKKNKNEGLVLFLTSTYEQRKKASETESASFNYLKGALNLYGFINWNNGLLTSTEFTNVFYPNSTWQTVNVRSMTNRQSSFQFGIDLKLSPKSTLSLVTSGNIFGKSDENANAKTVILNQVSQHTDSIEYILNQVKKTTNYKNADLNYNYVTDSKGSSLSATFDYLTFDSRQNQFLTGNSYADGNLLEETANSSLSPQNIKNIAGKVDYNLILPKKQSLAFGFKTSESKTDNNYKFFDMEQLDPDTTRSNHFIYHENIQAVYASYNKEWQKNSIQVGLRSEYTTISTEVIQSNEIGSQRYLKLFPSFFYLHSFSDRYKINFNFNVRVNRPSYWQLNPFKYYFSNYSYSQGNPLLTPSYTYNFQVGITLNNQFYLTPYFQIEDNHFQQVPTLNVDSNYFFYNVLNVGTITRYGLSLFTPTKITSFWSLNTQLNVFQAGQREIYLGNTLNYHLVTFYGRLNNQLTLSQKHSFYAELDYTYNSASQSFIYHSGAYSYLDAGLRKTIGKRGNLGLYCFDLLKTYPYTVRTNFYSQKSDFKNETESRFIRLTFSYKFGSQTVKQKQTRTSGNNEEKNRLN